MARMAFNPFPFDLMRPQRGIETFPQIDVLYRFFICCFPAALLPVVNPLRNALAHILAVRAEYHFTLFFQGFQRNDCRHQLHAIISGEVVALAKGFFAPTIA